MPRIPQPKDEGWIAKEFRKLWKAIRELNGQTRAESTSVGSGGIVVEDGGSIRIEDGGGVEINDGGGITINDRGGIDVIDGGMVNLSGGTVVVRDPSGTAIGFVGYIANYPDPNGAPQPGLAFYRADGTLAFSLLDSDATDGNGYHQTVSFFDASGNRLFQDDASGLGMAYPQIPYPVTQGLDLDLLAKATTDAFTVLAYSRIWRHMPKLWVRGYVSASGNAAGQYDLCIVDASGVAHQVPDSATTVGPGGSYAFAKVIDPRPFAPNHGDSIQLQLRARKTGGDADTAFVGVLEQVVGLGSNY